MCWFPKASKQVSGCWLRHIPLATSRIFHFLTQSKSMVLCHRGWHIYSWNIKERELYTIYQEILQEPMRLRLVKYLWATGKSELLSENMGEKIYPNMTNGRTGICKWWVMSVSPRPEPFSDTPHLQDASTHFALLKKLVMFIFGKTHANSQVSSLLFWFKNKVTKVRFQIWPGLWSTSCTCNPSTGSSTGPCFCRCLLWDFFLGYNMCPPVWKLK